MSKNRKKANELLTKTLAFLLGRNDKKLKSICKIGILTI